MRKKIAMRYRKDAMRHGAQILGEGMVFSPRELRTQNLSKKDNGYHILAKFGDDTYSVADDDMLTAYKLLLWCIGKRREPK